MTILNQRLESLEQFVELVFESLKIASQCKMLIFPSSVREEFSFAVEEKYIRGEEKQRILQFLQHGTMSDRLSTFDGESPTFEQRLYAAGLTGPELNYKLAEISETANVFYEKGGALNFSALLKKALILLKSLIGAIPGIGSALQELMDFIEQRVKDLTARS